MTFMKTIKITKRKNMALEKIIYIKKYQIFSYYNTTLYKYFYLNNYSINDV